MRSCRSSVEAGMVVMMQTAKLKWRGAACLVTLGDRAYRQHPANWVEELLRWNGWWPS
jgi:hypothetical protein